MGKGYEKGGQDGVEGDTEKQSESEEAGDWSRQMPASSQPASQLPLVSHSVSLPAVAAEAIISNVSIEPSVSRCTVI